MAGRGQVLGGRYRLVEKIGEGGMGTVWLAHPEGSEREVALKVLHKTVVGDEQAIARFRNEARAAGQLDHPNICRVLDVGEHDAVPFLVMERLRGESLGEALATQGALEPRAAAEIVVAVLAALEAAHAEGILHRDLKPENVFLVREGEQRTVKILDFGVAKFLGDDAARVRLTRTGVLVGTPAYMAPEQARGVEQIDARSDVWAVGVMLYEMLAGTLPYEAPNTHAMLVAIATRAPRPLEEVVPSLDPDLAAVVAQAMASDPRERFESARAMSEALEAWLAGTPVRRRTPRRIALPTPRAGSTPMSWAEESPVEDTRASTPSERMRARPWLMPLVLGVVLGAAAIPIVRHALAGSSRAPVSAPARVPIASPDAAAADNTVVLLGLPAQARVTLNGEPVSLPARLPAGQSARIAVEAPGFEPWSQTVTPTGDVALTYEGRRLAPVHAEGADAAVEPVRGSARGNTRGGRGSARGGGPTRPLRGGLGIDPDF